MFPSLSTTTLAASSIAAVAIEPNSRLHSSVPHTIVLAEEDVPSPWLARSGGDVHVACHVDVARRVDGHAPCRTRSELASPRPSRLRIGLRHRVGLLRRCRRSRCGGFTTTTCHPGCQQAACDESENASHNGPQHSRNATPEREPRRWPVGALVTHRSESVGRPLSYCLWERTYSARKIAALTRIMTIPTLMSRLSVLAASAPASKAIAEASNRTCTLVTGTTSY